MKSKHSAKSLRPAVVLLSGGLDSAVTLYLAKRAGFKCHCLTFDYQQRHIRELKSAKDIVRSSGSDLKIIKINLPWKGSSLLDSKLNISIGRKAIRSQGHKEIPNTYVPGRNIIFLSFAVSYAEAIGAKAIFIGAHTQDYSGYPDCRAGFFRSFNKVISSGTKAGVTGSGLKIITPLISKDKAEIIRIGARLKVPFEHTWSCYKGQRSPCAECDSCFYREKGFKAAGIKDPLLK